VSYLEKEVTVNGVYKALRALEKRSTVPLVGICVYEAVALSFPNRRTPPVTVLANRHKWVFPLFCGLLGLHVYCYEVSDGAW
jgi:hypothetical protein